MIDSHAFGNLDVVLYPVLTCTSINWFSLEELD
jgi:hypothetical protein